MKRALLLVAVALQSSVSLPHEDQLKFSLQKNENCLDLETGNAKFLNFAAWPANGWLVFNELPTVSDEQDTSLSDEECNKLTKAASQKLGTWVKNQPTAP